TDMLVAVLAVMKAGAAYVPLDPAHPAQRLAELCEDSEPVAVLTHNRVAEQIRTSIRLALAMHGEAPVIDLQADARRWKRQPTHDPARAEVGLMPNHLAYVLYTSGSTGRPKGVMIEHRGVVNYLWWAARSYAPDDGAIVSSSLSFDATVTSLLVPLLRGACVQLLPQGQEIEGLDARLRRPGGCGLVKITPAHLDALGQRLAADGASARAGLFVVGGEALAPSTVALWRRLQPGVRIVNEYGPTETVVGCVVHEVPEPQGTARSVPIGRPIANTRIYLLDRHRQPVPAGVIGEVYIGGAGVARGYLKRPELTAERFLPDPFAGDTQARMYRTGDLARLLPDGNLDYLGRNDFQVKLRGMRIELGEIEARLAQHPAVREAVVLAREDQPGDKRLVAYCSVSSELDAELLRQHLAQSLPDYMVPAAVVLLPEMPLTANGKLDRAALPAPDATSFGHAGFEAPEGEVETRLARIWSEVLQVERIGRHDDFFQLGGHSLLAVKVAARMREQGLHADVGVLFNTPTLAALAEAVGGEGDAVAVPPNGIEPGCGHITPAMLPLVQLAERDIERIVAMVPRGAANVQDIYPLAPLQQGILFHHLMQSQGDVYLTRAQFSFERREQLDRHLKAMQAVIDRHDILRTAIVWQDLPEPVQVVWREAALPVEEIALDADAGDAAQQLRERFDPRHCRLDVQQAPLMRVVIACDPASGRWLLLWLLHHLVADHTTLEVMHHEIEAHLLGRAARLPPPLPFRNFVAQAQRTQAAGEHESFFREMLGDVDEPTAPFGLADVQGDGREVAEHRLVVDAPLARRLRERAAVAGVSAASLCHLAWALVLARASGRDDVVFGTVLFGRMQGGEGADRVLGLFLNTLPLRIRLRDLATHEALRRTHALMARLLRHEHASLALAQRCSAVAPSTPLFSALWNYRHGVDASRATAPSAEALQAWEGVEFLGAEERTNYPLMMAVDDLGEGFALTAQAQPPVDAQRVCALMHCALQQLADVLEHTPDTPALHLDVLPRDERDRLLHEWNATAASYPQTGVHTLIEAQAARTPDALAVRCSDRQLSYGELDQRANRLAHHLRTLGAGPGTRVALCMPRVPELVVALLAVLKTGAAYVPLDPGYPVQRLAAMAADCAPAVLLTQALPEVVSAPLHAAVGAAPMLDLQTDAWRWAAQPASPLQQVAARADDLAYVIYTSGSTGEPKGVTVTHRGVVNLLWAMREVLQPRPADRMLALTTIAFDIAALELFLPLVCGAGMLLLDREAAADPRQLAQQIDDGGVTLMQATPATWRMLLDAGWQGEPSLKALSGGEALDGELARRLAARVAALWNVYGPTETTIWSTFERVAADAPARPHVPIGRPIANTQVYLLDARRQPVPVGVAGELFIGGDGVAPGYWQREALNAERFAPDPFAGHAGARMYRTGDLARWLPDGRIEFLGRNDFQVKLRGFRIELGEIEARLMQCEGVAQAVVVAQGEGHDKRLVAYCTSRTSGMTGDDVPPEPLALSAQLAATLPHYMLPSAIVMLDAMPLTANGKVDRKALPAPEDATASARGYEPPQGELEARMADLWAEVLQLPRVGRHDNFFELGGHSLLATRLVVRVRQEMDVDLPLHSLFAAPVLAPFAEAALDARLAKFAPEELHALAAQL
ncbi:partial arthrofactin-type cyclic lipopeptide synthetase C, partial [Burkholderiaceae bacterium]